MATSNNKVQIVSIKTRLSATPIVVTSASDDDGREPRKTYDIVIPYIMANNGYINYDHCILYRIWYIPQNAP